MLEVNINRYIYIYIHIFLRVDCKRVVVAFGLEQMPWISGSLTPSPGAACTFFQSLLGVAQGSREPIRVGFGVEASGFCLGLWVLGTLFVECARAPSLSQAGVQAFLLISFGHSPGSGPSTTPDAKPQSYQGATQVAIVLEPLRETFNVEKTLTRYVNCRNPQG